MRLLIKFPSRQRPKKFFQTLDLYYLLAFDIDNIQFIISLDTDDLTMNNSTVKAKLDSYKNLTYFYGNNKSKVEAVNADIPSDGWDILLLASDDMIPVELYYDQIIRNEMLIEYPDTDGVLWFYDGHRADLNTLCCHGYKYHQRFGYIYHPSYYTWYADEDYMYVSRLLKKETAYTDCIIEHKHFTFLQEKADDLARKQNNRYLTEKDRKTLLQRQSRNYDLNL